MDKTTVIKCLIDRLKALKIKNKVVILVPNDKKNVDLYNYIKSLDVNVFRGSNKNVLDRYYQAAKYFSADNIVRITSDCPFIDISILANMMKNFKRKNYDYYSNVHPRKFPRG